MKNNILLIMRTIRILIAEDPEVISVIGKALVGYDLVLTTTIEQATRMVMEDGIDLFVIGVHFDESRSVELITTIRKTEDHRDTPIIWLRTKPSKIQKALELTAHTMKSSGIISEYLEVEDTEQIAARLRACINGLLPALT